jgi:Domain of unknown function (DUF4381)
MSADWLSQLAPAHAPPPPGWWPPAPGWWLLAGVLSALVALGIWRRYRPQALRRRWALRTLRKLRGAGAFEADDAAEIASCARVIENVMRRYALAVFGRSAVARLSGEAWLQFAQRHGAAQLGGHSGRALLAAAFGGAVHDEREQWLAGAQAFVRQARAPRKAPAAGAET